VRLLRWFKGIQGSGEEKADLVSDVCWIHFDGNPYYIESPIQTGTGKNLIFSTPLLSPLQKGRRGGKWHFPPHPPGKIPMAKSSCFAKAYKDHLHGHMESLTPRDRQDLHR
jgi:hypothetical protein